MPPWFRRQCGRDDEAVDDDLLLAGLLARDPKALEDLLDRYEGAVYAVCSRILPGLPREDVEEAAAETFLLAWNRVQRYDPARAPLRTWVLMHAKYAALEHLRRSQRWLRPTHPSPVETPSDPFDALATKEERERIQAAIAQLAEPDRDILYRRYFLDEDIGRIAHALGLSRMAVDSRLWRTRKALRSLLAHPAAADERWPGRGSR